MPDDEPRETEQPDENPDAPGSGAEEAAGSDAERREDEAQEPANQEAPEQEASESPDAEAPQAGDDEAPAQPEPEASGESEEQAPEQAEEHAPEEEEPQAEAEKAGSDEPAKQPAKDVPPGAELEPISIEPERQLSTEERARLEAEAEERARAEAEATADAGEEPAPAREPAVELAGDARIQATGKRKTSIARVVLRSGTGEFQINKRSLEDYFPRHQHQTFVRQPLLTSGYEGKVDVRVRVHGGGIAGQAGAVRHGIARALTEIDPELRGDLKRRGLLTRDARAKERRKAGLKKARKRPQFSKR
jgi:small subunit ribosomal protein S9